jgi:MFS family permease
LSLGNGTKLLLAYSLIVFLVGTGDAILSYAAPVHIESYVNSTLLMGLILGFSSLVGIICDLLFAKIFRGKSFREFLGWLFVVAFIFPAVILFLPPLPAFFLLAMAAWGIYYELLHFSHFHLIETVVKRSDHALAWGVLESFRAAAYLIGPFLAGWLIDRHTDAPFYGSIGFFSAALVGFLFFLKATRAHQTPVQVKTEAKKTEGLAMEFKVWAALLRRVWPLFLFMVVCGFVDATFWSVGTLFAESLREGSAVGNLLFPAYTLPSLFVGLVVAPAARPLGKKRAALLAAIAAGVLLTLVGFVAAALPVVILVFLFSLFFSLTFPEIYATFEDYVTRLGDLGDDLVGLEGSAVSLAYIIGPILAGAIASVFGNGGAFAVAGLALVSVALFGLAVVPRKIRMPQEELAAIVG